MTPSRRTLRSIGRRLALGAVVVVLTGVVSTTYGLGPGLRSSTTETPVTTASDKPNNTALSEPWPGSPSQAGTVSPVSALTPSGSFSTSSDGQVIEGLYVTGRITIAHDNVTVRDTKLDLTGNYALHVPTRSDGSCPVGTVFENVEIDGALGDETYTPVYGEGCGFVLSKAYIHNTGQSVKIMGGATVQDSFIITSEAGPSGAHRNAIEARGNDNNILRNYLVCSADTGCSSALAIYNDVKAVSDVFVQGNFLAANAGYCVYGGSSHHNGFPPASNVDIFENAFSIMIHPQCGRAGFLTAHDNGINGNERSGNYVYETGQSVP